MDGDYLKSGLWGFYEITEDGNWESEGCMVTPDICQKLKAAGLGTVGKVPSSLGIYI